MRTIIFLVVLGLGLVFVASDANAQKATKKKKDTQVSVKLYDFEDYGGYVFYSKEKPWKNEGYRRFKVGAGGFYRADSKAAGAEMKVGFEPYWGHLAAFESNVRLRINPEESAGYSYNSLSAHGLIGFNFLKEVPGYGMYKDNMTGEYKRNPHAYYKKSPMYFTLAYAIGMKHYKDMRYYAETERYDVGWTLEHGPHAGVNIRICKVGKTDLSKYLWLNIYGEYLFSNGEHINPEGVGPNIEYKTSTNSLVVGAALNLTF